eukprot:Phypoly_transcript_11327.p1 GENE.Phypoly_transcript_11327~~Phypoly_transcript_11327.p1  ORF type:complete len:366 (+),score=65.65 Phypoly_transcript_11327:97-1194(+)
MELGSFIVCLILTVGYAGVLGAWCINWYKHRDNSGIPLHYYFGVTLSLQFIVILLVTVYFAVAPAFALAVLADILSYIAEGVFYSLLILIAIGWCIVETKTKRSHKINIPIFIAIYVGLEIFSLFTGSILLLLLALIILGLYFGLMYFVFMFTQRNIRRLAQEVATQEQPVPAQDSVPLESYPPSPSPSPYPPSPSPSSSPYTSSPSPYTSSPSPYPVADGAASYPPQPYPYPTQPYPAQPYPAQPYPASPYPPQQSGPQVVNVQPMEVVPPPPVVHTDRTPNTPAHERIPEAQEKLKLFRVFYKLMLVYIVVTIVLSFFPVFNHDFVLSYIRLYFIFFFLAGLCYVFRLRPMNQYFYLVLNDQV